MTSWTQRTAKSILVTTGIAATALALPAVAFASTGPTTSGSGSVGSGNQVSIPITIPIDVCGNAAALLGVSTAACQGGATVAESGSTGWPSTMHTSGIGSVLSGNQATAPVTAPVTVCGNAVGNATAHCPGGSTVHRVPSTGTEVTNGTGSVASGNQVVAPVTAPVDVCGNSVAVLGVAGAGCNGGATVGERVPVRPGAPLVPQCKCEKGSDGLTSLLPGYAAALGSLSDKLTSYQIPNPLPASLGTLPVISSLPTLGGLTNLSSLASTQGSGVSLPQAAA
jgi:hypothetical protein